MRSGDSRGLIDGNRLIVVGQFIKPVKRDGTMLFKPFFTDSGFILDLKHLYHETFGTKWDVVSIQQIAKGFHIKLKGVNDTSDAGFFSGESVCIYRNEIKGEPVDLLIGEKVYSRDSEMIGVIVSFSKTPSYLLFEIAGNDGEKFFVPFTEEFIVVENSEIRLIKEP
ncbi:MAG TPA: hypothetical protein PLW78_07235 [bacterium]|nr:hypothetical protein [bacterium]HPM46327.1 hypothetical protein [bacterium]HQI04357.1 hypothetical protein [bacterium]HQN72742.1 hypothetical protein [bacterium]HRQ70079.1 hypothetical protein [bacterium]